VPPSQVAAPPVFHRSPGQLLPVVPQTPFSFLLPSLSKVEPMWHSTTGRVQTMRPVFGVRAAV